VADRARNPFLNSPAGGRTLSNLQLPLFLLRPPPGYGVITALGRKTGKRRRLCIRAVRRGNVVYTVSIKGGRAGWAGNALANDSVDLRLPGGRFRGRARPIRDEERDAARDAYCEPLGLFTWLEYRMWRSDRPTPEKIRELHRTWFERGLPLAIDLLGESSEAE
jgi:deazaflavin-dependent oxidoreductase (nitroreductase family)